MARNVWIDHARRAALPSSEELAEVPERVDETEANFNADVSGWARSMIANLPDDDRVALELSELEGLPQKDVAVRLGLSLSGAKSRIQRGRAKLRAMILACCHLDFDGHGNVVDYRQLENCPCCPGES